MKHLKKTLSWLLAVTLLLALVPASSLAASTDAGAAAETEAKETASETVKVQTAEEAADAADGTEEADEAESASESNSGEDTSAEEETAGNSSDAASDDASSETETNSAAENTTETASETDGSDTAGPGDTAEEANASDESKENTAEEKEEAIAAAADEIAEETEEMLLEDAGTVSEEAMDATSTTYDSSTHVASATVDGTTYYYDTVQAAVSAANGAAVTLLCDISGSSQLGNSYSAGSWKVLYVTGTANIDLGGYTITLTDNYIYVSEGSLSVSNGKIIDTRGADSSSTYTYLYTIYDYAGSVSLANVTMSSYAPNSASYNFLINTYNGNETVTLDGVTMTDLSSGRSGWLVGVMLEGYYYSYSSIPSSGAYITTLVVKNSSISVSGSAIIGDGAWHNTSITVTDSTLVSTTATAIYHPQYGVMTISGSTITGADSGIEVRAGTVTISDSTISSTNTSYLGTYANGSGTSVAGAGIAVSQHSTNLPISVTITDCTVSGACAVYEEDQMDESSSNITISISGGTYTSYGTQKIVTESDGTTETTTTVNQSAVFSENVTAFISSGEFLSAVTSENGTVTTTTADIPLSYVSSSSVVVYISATDTTYVGTVSEINDYIAEAAKTDDLGEGDTITVLSDGGLSEVALTVPDQVTVSNATSATVSLNDDSVIIAANGSAEAHDIVSIAKAANCTQTGYSDDAYQCTVCGTFFKGTTGTDGTVSYTECSEADLTIAIDEDAHNYDDGVYTAATCTEDGYTTYTCANDESHTYTVTDEGTATGHSYGEPVWTWEETDGGYTATATFTCANDSSHVVVSEADVTSETKDGVIIYTATVTGPDGETVYTDTLETEAAADSEDAEEESEDDEDDEDDEEEETADAADDDGSTLADTGDTLNLSLWIALLLIAGAAIAMLCARTGKR